MPITITEQFIQSLATSKQDVLEAETLPPECYTDANFYEFEKEALFTHDWLCVGREEWVSEPGDYFTTSTVNEPIVVARNRKGELKAMSCSWPRGAGMRAGSCVLITIGAIRLTVTLWAPLQ